MIFKLTPPQQPIPFKTATPAAPALEISYTLKLEFSYTLKFNMQTEWLLLLLLMLLPCSKAAGEGKHEQSADWLLRQLAELVAAQLPGEAAADMAVPADPLCVYMPEGPCRAFRQLYLLQMDWLQVYATGNLPPVLAGLMQQLMVAGLGSGTLDIDVVQALELAETAGALMALFASIAGIAETSAFIQSLVL